MLGALWIAAMLPLAAPLNYNAFSRETPVPYHPPPRFYYAATLVSPSSMFVYGGLVGDFVEWGQSRMACRNASAAQANYIDSGCFLFHAVQQRWIPIQTNRSAPPPLALSTATHTAAGSIFLYGGVTCHSHNYGALWELSFLDSAAVLYAWRERVPSTAVQPPRRNTAHLFPAAPDLLLLFWGFLADRFTSRVASDYWTFNTTTDVWTRVNVTNPPVPRSSACIVQINATSLVLFGGLDSFFEAMHDLWLLDMPSLTWRFVASMPTLIPYDYSASVFDAELQRIVSPVQPAYFRGNGGVRGAEFPFMAVLTLDVREALAANTTMQTVALEVIPNLFTVFSRSGFQSVYVPSVGVLCYGGIVLDTIGSAFVSDTLLLLDLPSRSSAFATWITLPITPGPMATMGTGRALLGDADYYVFGGFELAGRSSSTLWRLDLAGSNVWTYTTTEGAPRLGLGGAAMETVNKTTFFVTGGFVQAGDLGRTSSVVANETYLVTITEERIAVFHEIPMRIASALPGSSMRPSTRSFAAALAVDGGRCVLVHGGILPYNYTITVVTVNETRTSVFGDTWQFCVDTLEWTQLSQDGPHVARTAAVYVADLDSATFFSGSVPREASAVPQSSLDATNAVWRFSLDTRQWHNLTQAIPQPHPRSRVSSAFASFGHKMVISGGFTSVRFESFDGPVAIVDLWVLDLVRLVWTQLEPTAGGVQLPFQLTTSVAVPHTQAMWVQEQTFPQTGYFIPVGCNVGESSADFATLPCIPCPRGSYANVTGASVCQACPSLTTTATVGATRAQECTVCSDASCHGHGSCRVTDVLAGTVECNCNAFFLPADRCATPWIGIILAMVLSVGLLVLVVVRSSRRSRRYFTLKSATERLLSDRDQQVEELESMWRIDYGALQSLRLIGAGAMGDVFAAEWIGKRVAVKLLKEAVLESDSESLAEFEREAAFLRSVRHANVVFFYGAGVRLGVPFLVTELMSRGSLKDALADRDLSLSSAQRLAFMRDIASAMAMLHSLNRLHRDLKSDNVLIGTSENSELLIAKVGDFGCSTLLATAQYPQQHRQRREEMATAAAPSSMELTRRVGTPLWQAPEVLRNEKDYSFPVDVYSYGVIVWEVWTREVPYQREGIESVWQLEEYVLEGGRPSLTQDGSQWPQGVCALVERAWSHIPAQRPTFAEIVEELCRF